MHTVDTISEKEVSNNAGATSAKANTEVFSDPNQFLKTLQTNFDNIASSGEKYLTKVDLDNAAHNGKDSTTRAVAGVALAHYDELQKMSIINPKDQHDGISKDDLKTDRDLLSPDLKAKINEERFYTGIAAVAAGASTVITGFATAASFDMPPIAFVLGAGTLTFAGCTEELVRAAYTGQPEKLAKAAANKTAMSSWSELSKV